MQLICTLVLLFTFAIGNVWGAAGDATTSNAPKSGGTNKDYANTISVAAGYLDGNVMYYISNNLTFISTDGLEANYLGFVFKPSVDLTIDFEGFNGNSGDVNITYQIDSIADAAFYEVFTEAGSNKISEKIISDNGGESASSTHTVLNYWKNNGVVKYSSKKWQSNGDNAPKNLAGQQNTTYFGNTRLVTDKVVAISSTKSAAAGTYSFMRDATNKFVFKAGKVYRIYSTRGSSKTGYKSFTFTPVYQLTWNFDEGSSSETAGTDYTAAGYYAKGAALTYPSDESMSKGDDFVFDGWSSSATTMPTSALTITAQWAEVGSCVATAPGAITKGTASEGVLTLTAEGTPADNNTWYWQDAADGTATDKGSGATKNVNAAGTYYLRSFNDDGGSGCWSSAKSVTVAEADLLTAINPTLSYAANVFVGGTLSPTLEGNTGSGSVSYELNDVTPAGCMTIDEAGVVTAVAPGTATVTATIAKSGYYAGNTATSGTITVVAAPTHMVENRLVITNGASWGSSIYTTDGTNITNLSAFNPSRTGEGAINVNAKTANGSRSTNVSSYETENAENYMVLSFKVADGKRLRVSAVSIEPFSVSNTKYHRAWLADADGNKIVEATAELAQNACENVFANVDFSENAVYLTGTNYLKLWTWGSTNGYRLNTPIYIDGVISDIPAVSAPSISAPTEDQSAEYTVGATIAPLEVTASGYPAPTYQWYKNTTATATIDNDHIISGATNASYIPANDEASGFYYYCVVTNSVSSTTSPFFHVVINLCNKPGTPDNLAASNESYTTADFAWDAAANAAGYKVSILKKSDESVVLDWTDCTTNAYAATGLAQGTKYIFKVKAIGETGYCEYGLEASKDFTTTAPSVADLVTIADDWTFTPSATIAAGTLTADSKFFASGSNACDMSNGKMRVKENRALAFNVNSGAKVKVTFTEKSDDNVPREMQLGTAMTGDANKVYGHSGSNPATFTVTADGVVYLTASKDLYFTQLEIMYPHSVSYALNGGTADPAPTQTAKYVGEKFTVHDGVTGITAPTGMEFDKWKDQDNADVAASAEYTMPAKAVTLTAQWKAEATKYAVTYDLNGYDAEAPTQASKAAGDVIIIQAAPARDGYDFLGWKCNIDEATYQAGAEYTMTAAATTFTAQWYQDPCPDKNSIVRVVMTGANAASSTGYNSDEYAAAAIVNNMGGTPEAAEVDANHDGNENGYKLNGGGACLFAQLKTGTFQEGDVVKVTITKINDNYKVNNVAQQILDIYYGSSASDATLLTTISNVAAAGTYSYRLTATDVTTIGDKKCIGIYRPSSGRVQNQYVYSVEVAGCREWTVFHTLTFKNADGSETVADPALAEGAYASTVAPKAPRVSSHHFLGWSTTTNDADAIVNLAEYTITEDKTLYAVYAENDCSGNGLMFSQVAKANTLSEDYSLSGTTEESIGEYATVTGGEVYLNNNSSNTRVKITKTTSAIQLTGGDEGYIHVLLDCSLKEKDTIKVDNTNKWVIAHNASKTDKVSLASSVHFFIVPAEWEGKDEFYIWRDGSSCNISTIQVVRPVLYTVSFDMMEHGSAIAALTSVPENGKITAPTAPTADNYSFGGWYKEEACTNAWDFANDVVTANTTLYAKWLNLYTVSFDMMEHGSAIAVLMDVPENSKITAPNVPTDENYYFEGWYKENTLENEWNFASDVVTDNTILYAKWNDKSDATLKSLYYGDVEIALEAGVYTYDVNLSPVATTVPALTAETNNPNATKQITNGTLDEEGHAQSTVVVTPEKAGATTQTYTVNFTKVHLYTELVDVTGPTTWDWTGLGNQQIDDVDNRGVILANYVAGTNFEKIEGKAGEYAVRNQNSGVYQGTYLHFNTTVAGKVKIYFRAPSGGENCTITIKNNGNEIVAGTRGNSFGWSKEIFVKGDVVIEMVNDKQGGGTTRVQQIVFSTTPDYTRDQMLGNGVYGTLCVDHNVPLSGINGATFYELQGRENTYGKLVFDEVISGELTAGKPYVFQAHGDVFTLFYGLTKVDEPVVAGNGMYGTFEEVVLTELTDVYYFAQRALWSCDGAIDLTIPANRAYVKLSEIDYLEPNNQPAPGRRRVTMAVNGEKVVTDIDNLFESEKPIKVMIDGQLFIIRGEKMFDATGRLVK